MTISNESSKIDFIELQIIDAVKKLHTGRVNEIMSNWNFLIPLFEFSDYIGTSAITPVINLLSCERSEKERIIQLDTYSMTITITLSDNNESEMYCYGYAHAIGKAIKEDVTLGGVVDRALITGQKVVPPKIAKCSMYWELVLTLRITVEGMHI